MAETIEFACPNCRAALEQTSADKLTCPGDGLHFLRIDGTWRFLLPGRLSHYEKFIKEYETVRLAEGRGMQDAAYYRALPEKDLSGKMSADWRIRAASYHCLMKEIIIPAPKPLRILDIGSGNGWLSNRLAQAGHQVLALDLLTNDFDGLGCQRFYDNGFTTAQAEFDRLPCADAGVDVVIFNASLHYSENFHNTLAEALRAINPDGSLVVMDSPVYRDVPSGESMVREREAQFTQRYGFPSNALRSENYITYDRLERLGHSLGIRWRVITPNYGIRWTLRPFQARLLGRREPASFHLISGSPDRKP